MDKRTRQRYLHQKRVFCSLRSLRNLAQLLKMDIRHLQLLAQNPRYKTFTIPKKNGGERLIEDPHHELKTALSRLNAYLQSVYYFEKSRAAFGFILGVRNDEDRRNVFTNAKKHLGKAYLLNIDLKDFFHSISREKVLHIFEEKPFQFKGELLQTLADLTTYNARLPMGAPTSPTLSNLACRTLDEQLEQLAKDMLWSYTRYADDMSFSSNQAFNAEKINTIRQIVKAAGFTVHPNKVQKFGPGDAKIVTGLLVADTVRLAPDYLPLLKSEIDRLKAVYHAQNEQGKLQTKWVNELQQQVRGRLNFAGFVMGKSDQVYQELKDLFYEAIHPPQEEFGAVSWRAFPYKI